MHPNFNKARCISGNNCTERMNVAVCLAESCYYGLERGGICINRDYYYLLDEISNLWHESLKTMSSRYRIGDRQQIVLDTIYYIYDFFKEPVDISEYYLVFQAEKRLRKILARLFGIVSSDNCSYGDNNTPILDAIKLSLN